MDQDSSEGEGLPTDFLLGNVDASGKVEADWLDEASLRRRCRCSRLAQAVHAERPSTQDARRMLRQLGGTGAAPARQQARPVLPVGRPVRRM